MVSCIEKKRVFFSYNVMHNGIQIIKQLKNLADRKESGKITVESHQ